MIWREKKYPHKIACFQNIMNEMHFSCIKLFFMLFFPSWMSRKNPGFFLYILMMICYNEDNIPCREHHTSSYMNIHIFIHKVEEKDLWWTLLSPFLYNRKKELCNMMISLKLNWSIAFPLLLKYLFLPWQILVETREHLILKMYKC